MTATLPRSKKSSAVPKLSQSSTEAQKGKKQFIGTGESSSRGKAPRSKSGEIVQHHPWSGILQALLRPFPPDIRYNIQRALGGFGEAIGRMFPQQPTGDKIQVGRRGF